MNLYEINKLEYLRHQREIYLHYFDMYKTNVIYGIIQETNERKKYIINWYNQLLDITISLDENVFKNTPIEIINLMPSNYKIKKEDKNIWHFL